ncbi:hypothetical protein SGCOL_006273 [Colletotrichum sp. CLE4]
MARVRGAADTAFAHDFISNLPDGYDMDIGQRGGLLSGGQKQRIAIARSIVSSPTVLLLDETTSALDPHAESVVQKALDKASQDYTTIVIAHKLATIQRADNIVAMRNGIISKQGNHEALLRNDGLYTRLVQVQGLKVLGADSDSEHGSHHAAAGKIEAEDSLDMTRTLTQQTVTLRRGADADLGKDDYDLHKQKGIFSALAYIARETPELAFTYSMVLMACVTAGATFPGQAVLLSHVMEVFELTGSAMERRG